MEPNYWQERNKVISDIEILNPVQNYGRFARFEANVNGAPLLKGLASIFRMPGNQWLAVISLSEPEDVTRTLTMLISEQLADDILGVITNVYGEFFNARSL